MSAAKVDAYIARSAPFAQPILTKLRELVHKAVPDAEEVIRWGVPFFEYHGSNLCGFAAFKKHCMFNFWKAKLMADPYGLLETADKTAMGSLGKMTSLDNLPSDRIMIEYLREAARLNERGVKVQSTPKERAKPVTVPDYFTKALKRNKKALAVFEKSPPSHKREYIGYITEAKKEETRQRRIEKSIDQLEKGLGRNWNYK